MEGANGRLAWPRWLWDATRGNCSETSGSTLSRPPPFFSPHVALLQCAEVVMCSKSRFRSRGWLNRYRNMGWAGGSIR
ncbi:hypothetical protein MGG_16450 [Pyricularia oryzae 70-15]|uniref:Uncharacterized protein n=4 Tax=Pyricularia oryzae TaxID=318829 RepID=G4MPG1_PYRO7|nr:uncharacterized protein MGG_16450 [Pyricularia oryzae 70-15]ELQ37866.1 hypothetical protein OOU_Y34scaffold00567g13 [Pyricularia oryzae Y34]KAI7915476.1 hypothetical protein M9X92_008391 [Pyricularia oryzae]EHA58004.1 hypothetical protein MGG_16450 [Pyricularia oryzae 70-15]KAI7928107.1 hypothetical protein M0657_002790 [Pyricularia oryzae]QBZ63851.1 hypothetical protein PoMZ_05542 [Pyricularia oryzae]